MTLLKAFPEKFGKAFFMENNITLFGYLFKEFQAIKTPKKYSNKSGE
jgi:hypothetical protein